MKKALLVIDYTNDFVADDGALTAGKPAQDIEENIVNKIKEYVRNGNDVIVINDVHFLDEENHPENKLFPPHNIAGTEGREMYGKVREILGDLYMIDISFYNKQLYTCFSSSGFVQRYLEGGYTELELCGVCTDICILHTAIDAYNIGCKVVVDSDCVASFDEVGHRWALDHFRNVLGFEVL